jgi:hypothetical protein
VTGEKLKFEKWEYLIFKIWINRKTQNNKNLIPVLYIFNIVLTALIVIGTDGMDRCNNILKMPTG